MDLRRNTDGTLRALERSRSVALEEAQALRSGRSRDLGEREAERAASAQARESAYETQRHTLAHSTGGFSVEQLTAARRYADSLLAREREARAACEQAERLLREAQEQAQRRLEELRAVERLRARRRAVVRRRRLRMRERRLDELGLIQASSNQHLAGCETGEACPQPE